MPILLGLVTGCVTILDGSAYIIGSLNNQYIKILLVCLSVCLFVCLYVTDVGVAITNLRVVCKIIACVPAVTEIFSR